MHWTLMVLAVLLLMVDIAASASAMRDPLLSGSQRIAQLALIWLVPVLGAVFCLVFRSTIDRAQPSFDREAFVDSSGADGTQLNFPRSESLGGYDAPGGDGGGDGGGGD